MDGKIITGWMEKFDRVFKYHPDREKIQERILSDEPISVGMIDNWWAEADWYTLAARDKELQAIAGEEAA